MLDPWWPLRFMKFAIIFTLPFFLIAPTFAQSPGSAAQADLDQLVQGAQNIVRGHVTSVKSEPHPQFPNIKTLVITLAVTKVLKGTAGSTLSYRQFQWDSRDQSVFEGFKGSGEVVLFLNPVSAYGLTNTVGLEQGRFRVLRNESGGQIVLNGRNNLELFSQIAPKGSARGIVLSKKAQQMLSNPKGPAPLEAFEETVQTLVGAAQ
jgi:hypothetical protein